MLFINASEPVDFKPAGFFVLKSPLLPFDELSHWSNQAGLDDGAPAGDVAEAKRNDLRMHLRSLTSSPELRDALFIASPSLVGALESWPCASEKRRRKIDRALVKYFSRMATRATPFGLFAGWSFGQIGSNTSLAILPRSEYQPRTKINIDALIALVERLLTKPTVRRQLLLRLNSSLYVAGGRLHYVAAQRDRGGCRAYNVVTTELTWWREAMLSIQSRKASFAECVALLTREHRANRRLTVEEAESLVDDFVSSQFLIPELGLAVTGPQPIDALIEKLQPYVGAEDAVSALTQARERLRQIDGLGIGRSPRDYLEIKSNLDALVPNLKLSSLFRVDLCKPAPGLQLGVVVVDELKRSIALLQSLTPHLENPEITAFRASFANRYGDREVSLVQALDRDSGIGFPPKHTKMSDAFLLRDIPFFFQEKQEMPGAINNHLMSRLAAAIQLGAQEIELSEQDVVEMRVADSARLPSALTVRAVIAARDGAAIDNGEFHILLRGISGPSWAASFGRFCHADTHLKQAVYNQLQVDRGSCPDVVFAEIAHLPEGCVGDVVHRPVMSDYEIPYLAAVEETRELPITDLTLMLTGERICLRSRRLNCEVIPRLSNPHNYDLDPHGTYRFLCALQEQHVVPRLSWSWGALEAMSFLPRLRCGRVVLARARWRTTRDEVRCWTAPRQIDERYAAFQVWSQERKIPRWIVVSEGDHEFVVDRNNPLCVDAMIHLVQNQEAFNLMELFPDPELLCVRSPEGRFFHEIVAPFAMSRPEATRQGAGTSAPRSSVPSISDSETFAPGSEWLYVKLYSGTSRIDGILKELVASVVREATVEGWAKRWFFIRCCDPDWHLRVRFEGEPRSLISDLLPYLYSSVQPLLDDGSIWKVQLDTYRRELRRYGGSVGMLISEEWFQCDSDSVLALITNSTEQDPDHRWKLALVGLDYLLTDYGFDLVNKAGFVAQRRESFKHEFGTGTAALKRGLGNKFRAHRKEIAACLRQQDRDTPPRGTEILHSRSQQSKAILAKLRANAGLLSTPPEELLVSFAHLYLNRLFAADHREQEMVIYELLGRHYDAELGLRRAVNRGVIQR